jgi:hypothetical protein
MPPWFARHNENKWEAGFVLLQQQPGGIDGAIASARSAGELSAIRDLAETGHDYESGRRALERVIKDFPSDPYAMFAADRLAALYDKEGKADRAKELRERYGRLSQNDALACNQIQSESNKRSLLAAAAIHRAAGVPPIGSRSGNKHHSIQRSTSSCVHTRGTNSANCAASRPAARRRRQ